MAGDPGRKEEEKFEFTPEGEALGYISLEQARVVAMQTARDEPGNYGNRFSGTQMVFEVVEQDEGDDYYIITMSFRPAGDFTGAPGQEQFFIEKEGAVAVRQMLSLPRPEGGRRLPIVPIIAGLAVVAIVGIGGAVFISGGLGGGGESEVPAVLVPTATPPAATASPIPTPTVVPAIIAATPRATRTPTLAPTPTPVIVQREVVVTATPGPTPVPTRTPTPVPTPTPAIVQREVQVVVTATPAPTAAPAATLAIATPAPTATPRPRPTKTPVPAVAVGGIRGGFINMQQYTPVRQRQIYQSSITNMNLSPMMNLLLMYDPETDDQTDIVCDLCIGWDLLADGRTYIFHLNRDARWQDGVPVTARDVVFSFDAMVNPDQFEILRGRSTSSTINAGLYYQSGNAREIDELTVEIATMFPSGAFLAAIAVETSAIMAAHTVLDQGIIQGAIDMAALNGSGPFLFVEEVRDASVEYARNPDYWKPGRPFIDGMEHFIITDAGRAIAAYKTGQILTTNWISNLTPKEARNLDEEMDNLTVFWGGPTGGLHVHMNTTVAPFDDPRVRQAVNLAIHRQPIIEITSGGSDAMGYKIPEGFWFSRTAEEYAKMPGYREMNGQKHPDDILAARRLLVEAGIPEGLRVQLSARNCCGYPDQAVQVSQQLQDFFGWDVELRVMESSAGFEAYWAGDFEMMVQASALNYMDPDAVFSGQVRGALPQWLGGGSGKFFAVEGVEEIFFAQQVEQDLEKRRALTHEIGNILMTQGTATASIYWTMRDHPVENRIQNFHFDWNNKKWEHVWCDPAC